MLLHLIVLHFEILNRQIAVDNLIVGAVLAYVIRTRHVIEQLTEVCVLPVVDGLTC